MHHQSLINHPINYDNKHNNKHYNIQVRIAHTQYKKP